MFTSLFWEHKDQKGDSKQREGSASVWFVAHRGICGSTDRNHRNFSGNIFTAETLPVFVKQLILAVSIPASQTDAKTTIAAKATSSCLLSFSAESSYQTKIWVYQEERVCHVACTETASSDERSRCWLACGFVTCKLSWLTDISPPCICWAVMKGLTPSKRHIHKLISASGETYVGYYFNQFWLPACK